MLSVPNTGYERWLRRILAGALAAVAACATVVMLAGPARADAVRNTQMWVLDALHAQAAWRTTQGRGVTVAVLDSGVNPAVSDLAGSVITGPDYTGVGTSPSNPHWGVHGTWMASLIAGHGHGGGGDGILGVAPRSKVLSIRVVTDPKDPGYRKYEHESDSRVQHALANAIRYATTHHAVVISMSLGYGAPSRPVRDALQYALDRGVVVVASSGNSGETASARQQGHAPYSFPADYPGVLGVGAVARNGSAARFSSYNLSVEVAAPGVKVPAEGRDGQYWLVSGTSPACALTAGVAALIKSRYPRLPPALVDQAITSSTRNRPRGGYDDQVGFGTADAVAALAAAGRLAHDSAAGRGAGVAARFGGGPASVPPVPVPPRGAGQLVAYLVLAFGSLVLTAVAAVRLTRMRRRARQAGIEPGERTGTAAGWGSADRGLPGAGPGPSPPEQGRWRHAAPGPPR